MTKTNGGIGKRKMLNNYMSSNHVATAAACQPELTVSSQEGTVPREQNKNVKTACHRPLREPIALRHPE